MKETQKKIPCDTSVVPPSTYGKKKRQLTK